MIFFSNPPIGWSENALKEVLTRGKVSLWISPSFPPLAHVCSPPPAPGEGGNGIPPPPGESSWGPPLIYLPLHPPSFTRFRARAEGRGMPKQEGPP